MFVMVQHKVRDYDDWKPAFDGHQSTREQYGCRSHQVFRGLEDPNDITIIFDWESPAKAEEFMRDPSLAEAMQKGGVIGEPRATMLDQTDSMKYAQRQAA